jgi:outer membrane lipoprotein-sorting protein
MKWNSLLLYTEVKMQTKINISIIIILLSLIFCGACTAKSQQPAAKPVSPAPEVKTEVKADPNRIDPASELGQLLEKINAATKTIVGCQAAVDYLFVQEPDLLNSKTLRKGTLYYQKTDKGSKLRLNFDSIKQDEGEEQKKVEQYVFDGVWLTKIDFALRQVDQYQQAPIDKPVNVFEYISRHFPIVGFSGTEVLEKQFFIRLIPAAEGESKMVHLELKVRPDSVYKDDYTQIDLWIHRDNYLPVKMKTTSIQGDIYEINLSKMELNKTLPDKIFNIETPADFSKNVKTLQQKPEGKDSQWPQEL